jgi:xanthine dehydrogenase YagR molybdenum-binding subunit
MSDAAPAPKANMGAPLKRVDGRLKVTGEARYAADIPVGNLAHAVLVTSTIARGRIRQLDLAAARAVPGVLDIFTCENAGGLAAPKLGSASTSVMPLNSPQIWHDGQIIGLVVADTLEAAEEAAGKVRVDYDREAPSAGFDALGSETIPAVGNTERHKEDPKVGDAEAAFAAAPVKVDATYDTPTEHHNPIELFSTTCVWSDGELTVNDPSQFVYGWKNGLARELGIDAAKVRVVAPYVGGAFGSKGPLTPRTAIVALAAKRLNRPIRCVVTRRQAYSTVTYRAETRHRIRVGADPSGRILAFLHQSQELTSRPDNYVVGGTDTTARMYGYGSVLTEVTLVKADRNTPGYMRAPPEFPYMYALESAMDELAVALKMDPIALRRLNDTQTEPIKGYPFTSRSLARCFDEAAQAFGWDRRDPAVGAMRDGDWLIGWGCATACYPTHTGAATARIRLMPTGRVRVQTAAHDVGTGAYTVISQMAAERLGVPIDNVTAELGDSALPPAPVAGGSNTTASVCSTVLKGCDAIRDKLFAAVAGSGPFAAFDPRQLDLKDERLVGPDGSSMALEDAFRKLGTSVIEEYVEFFPAGGSPADVQKLYGGEVAMQGGSGGKKMMYAFGAQLCEVRVHARTFEMRVPRIVGAFAAGRIMNTRTAHSQLMGGMIWGISSALQEKTEIDRRAARYVNRDIAEYHVPVNADIREVKVILVPETDTEVNPAGVKGLGELGNVGTAAAVQSAVYHATGKRIRSLPIRLDDLIGA